MQTVTVYDFVFADGVSFGCGTALELKYWQQEGVIDPDARLGSPLCEEPASEDARRKTCWGIGDFLDTLPVSVDPTGEHIDAGLLA